MSNKNRPSRGLAVWCGELGSEEVFWFLRNLLKELFQDRRYVTAILVGNLIPDIDDVVRELFQKLIDRGTVCDLHSRYSYVSSGGFFGFFAAPPRTEIASVGGSKM